MRFSRTPGKVAELVLIELKRVFVRLLLMTHAIVPFFFVIDSLIFFPELKNATLETRFFELRRQ